jgi:hypothetical protein
MQWNLMMGEERWLKGKDADERNEEAKDEEEGRLEKGRLSQNLVEAIAGSLCLPYAVPAYLYSLKSS